MSAKCSLCETRKAKRFCPARNDSICNLCCGREREVTIRCPFACEYLRESRKHEDLAEMDPKALPNADIELTRGFLDRHAPLGQFLGESLWVAAAAQPEALDSDVREALEALIRTYRTMQSGLIYETRPSNPYAANIAGAVRRRLEELQERLREQAGMATLRDTEILGMLVFFQRTELQVANGRRLGRAFLDVLRQNHEGADLAEPPEERSPLLG